MNVSVGVTMKERLIKKVRDHFLIFAFVLLVALPLIHVLFIEGDLFSRIRTAFILNKLNKLVILPFLILLIVIFKKASQKSLRSIKINYFLLVFASLIFILSFLTQGNIEKILNEDVFLDIKNNKSIIDFDSPRFFNLYVLNDIGNSKFIELNKENSIRKIINLDIIPESPKLSFALTYLNEDADFYNTNLFVSVNNNEVYLTRRLDALKALNKGFLSITLPKEYLTEGENVIDFYFSGEGRNSLYLFSENVYFNENIYTSKDNGLSWERLKFNPLIFIEEENKREYKSLFKLGSLFRYFGIILLFIACFGLEFSKYVFKKFKKELLFSFLFTLFLAFLVYLA